MKTALLIGLTVFGLSSPMLSSAHAQQPYYDDRGGGCGPHCQERREERMREERARAEHWRWVHRHDHDEHAYPPPPSHY